jgi:hypothetical protein
LTSSRHRSIAPRSLAPLTALNPASLGLDRHSQEEVLDSMQAKRPWKGPPAGPGHIHGCNKTSSSLGSRFLISGRQLWGVEALAGECTMVNLIACQATVFLLQISGTAYYNAHKYSWKYPGTVVCHLLRGTPSNTELLCSHVPHRSHRFPDRFPATVHVCFCPDIAPKLSTSACHSCYTKLEICQGLAA